MPTPKARRGVLVPILTGVLVIGGVPTGARAPLLADAGADVSAPKSASHMPAAVLDPSLEPRRTGDDLRAAAAFDVTVDGQRRTTGLVAFTVLPGARVLLDVDQAPTDLRYQAGSVKPAPEGGWQWTAPEAPGIYAIRMQQGGEGVDLTALVLHPATSVRRGSLNGYRIGSYPERPLRGDPAYIAPEGFLEVPPEAESVLVSPRLTLGQFLCKQPGDPRYVAVSIPLVEKLEAIADHLEGRGIDPAALTVMSGYRTPAYNAAIGNTTSYSRHLWGDAADIFIDADGDGDMDDLDGNGRVDEADARLLSSWIDDVVEQRDVRPGGMAVYRRNAVHGPFVHVDARGTRARW